MAGRSRRTPDLGRLCPAIHGGRPTYVVVGTGHNKSWWGSQHDSSATVGVK
ncbi:proline-rich receptor-like protein kinase PERK9 [Iris pallida]|uniref:Proline-rich receptor-like protein kinase PERK9 n=1 Tax=Iris pallida TaxID=29817 RepID=A0AAX6ELV0_IRIPA|nr:proline-rich receptor-like protein kinase PERK9 [Iris pallida]